MSFKPARNDLYWTAAGVILTLAFLAVMMHFHRESNPAAQLAFKMQRLQLVRGMRLDLAEASEAEQSAVMAVTDEESETFADQARAATAAVERGRVQMTELLRTGGTADERNQLAAFSRSFVEFQRIDRDLLDLAVRNTNLKAYALAFGPAADALQEVDSLLSRIETLETATAASSSVKVMELASDARIRALRIQALLPPHIGEASEPKMNALEARIAKEDQGVRADLKGLAALLQPGGSALLRQAASRYDAFMQLEAQIVRLSRENTNVRSLTLSLNERRRVVLECQDSLAALEQTIQQETAPAAPALPR